VQPDFEYTAAALVQGAQKAINAAIEPLLRRIEELEARQPEKGEQGLPGNDGRPGADGADGAGIADLLIDRDHCLIATFTDGRTKNLGVVVGRDGERGEPGSDGRDGADADMGELKSYAAKLVASLPAPKDGITPSVDFEIERDAGVLSFDFGDIRSSFEIPLPYAGTARGLYDPDAEYRAMDVVSFNGSEWRAKCDSPGALPGDGWMLSAQRGKRGDRGERGERGIDGRPGKDGAQPIGIGFDPDDMKFTMVLDDGNSLEADFDPVARAIRGA
jgi:hypothetical protein